MFAGITMVSNVPFYSFKDINLKKSVPFWAVLAIVAGLTVIATKPAVVLFLLVVAYSISGYVQWVMKGRPGRIV
jgi:CDP-diacylglycerol--serine O-phosphatidyltransferase